MVRGRGIVVTAVALMYQCALTTRMARGRGTAWPNARQAWVYRLSSRAFIGLPCPKNAAGIVRASFMASLPGSRYRLRRWWFTPPRPGLQRGAESRGRLLVPHHRPLLTGPDLSPGRSVAGHAAVDGQRDAGDVGRGRAGQEDHDGIDLVLLAHPAEGGGLGDELVQHVARDRIGHLAAEIPGRDRVDPDPPAARPLLVQVAGQPDEAGLAGRVGRLRRERLH